MNRSISELVERARARYARIERQHRTPRYRRVLGRFVAAGLLETNDRTLPHRGPLRVPDALWAGELEPRILELLPALLIKRGSLFEDRTALPFDLARTVRALRRAEVPANFRGIPGVDLVRRLSPPGA